MARTSQTCPVRRSVRALVVAGVVVGAALLTRRMTQTWGTLAGEADTALPGDDLLPDARVVATRGIGVDAPPRDVWPWLVQLGYCRGGFYSYDALERMIGLDIHSADTVEDRWQDLAVGDPVLLADGVVLQVADLEQDRHLVLRGSDELPGAGAAPYDFTWSFVLRRVGTGTRLLVRERYVPHGPGSRALVEAVQPVSFLMTQRMLRGVRDRAERR
ncbi:SRPBCC family protein [Xylanimonas protaetiae]|uniref:SRPBCC family protein n=1 Tax=Xylanimonas protaetiae TaxID=2509457 RepID=A0A4P6F515_9MICO|nr:SRPBCC family protein [Xylanimonas protaetiae]QAY69833.1 SRPBCC family protein [Xylanimonas protaetiae]